MFADPIQQFLAWYQEAEQAGVPHPETVALATATKQGRPSLRIVLYRGMSSEGPRFFTNYESRKGRELAENPRAALLFHWDALGRQVRFEGLVERLCAKDSDEYFAARPRGHQINALASVQSAVLSSREDLLQKRAALEAEYEGRAVPRPSFWGGYHLMPERVEFWQEGADRFHDRRLYTRQGDSWSTAILSP
jgi:pyridoxamine 5'-phosphate oxidase